MFEDPEEKVTVGQTLSFTKALFVGTFRHSKESQHEIKKIEKSLYSRAWVFHIIGMLSRTGYPLLGIAVWQQAFDGRTKNEDINQGFIDDYEFIIKTVIISLIPFGIVLDLICYWRRDFARFIFYYELICLIVQGFVPIDRGDFGTFFLLMLLFYLGVVMSTTTRMNILAAVATFIVLEFGPIPIVHQQDWKLAMVLSKLLYLGLTFILLTFLGMMLTYIAQIRG